MSPSNRNSALVLASGARYHAGYLRYTDTMTPHLVSTNVETRGFCSTTPQNYWMENIYDRSSKICRTLQIGEHGSEQKFGMAEEQRGEIVRRLLSAGKLPRESFVAVHPFSGWSYKNWPAERFVSMIEVLGDETNMEFVILCSTEDIPSLGVFEGLRGSNHRVRLFPSNDLCETAVLLGEASLFVGNDSGPLHLASALGVRTIGLFGAASPTLTGPRDRQTRFVFHPVECSPCGMQVCVRPHDSCMGLITVREVVDAVRLELDTAVAHRRAAHA